MSPTGDRRRHRIFLAEDDASLRALVRDSLLRDGDEVIELTDGGRLLVELAASIRAGGNGPPDLIVSDIHMPVMSGLQMAMAVREVRRELPIILMTAFPDPDLAAHLRLLDTHLLPKPFALDALASLVARCLGRS